MALVDSAAAPSLIGTVNGNQHSSIFAKFENYHRNYSSDRGICTACLPMVLQKGLQWFPDNSALDNSARTIRRGQFGATIRLGQFSAKYDINFIESSAFIQRYSFHQSRFYFSNIFSIIPHLFQQYSFHQSRLVLDIVS